MILSLIAAMSENRVIGHHNRLPWNLPDEWSNFKKITQGKPFLMGRKSYESGDGLFSDYRNVVLSTQPQLLLPKGFEQARDLPGALALLQHESEVFVLGGAEIFEELLPRAHRLYLSIVHAQLEGDAFFPEIPWADWTLTQSVRHEADEHHAYAFSMNQYLRNGINP
jgi:dihydrofolate reductase